MSPSSATQNSRLKPEETEATRQSPPWFRYNRRVEVTVLLFASVAEKAGWRRRVLPLEAGDTVASVRDRLVADHPQLRESVSTLLYALNEEYVREHDAVPPGSTLALIPPVSGG